ncbi:MAG: sugar phosphate isomerase/epimerase family protein [Gemmataceae bacterium]
MARFTISAFADEISPDPIEQLDVLSACGVRYVELRSIYKTNVLDLTTEQIDSFLRLLQSRGMGLSAIGSPIGKISTDDPFEPHLKRFERAIELCGIFGTKNIRIFSFYPPAAERMDSWRDEAFRRMEVLVTRAAEAGVVLFHENEHRIYGETPEHVEELLHRFPGETLAAAYDAANFVYGGHCPWDGWLRCRDRVRHLHIKDWIHAEPHGCIAGTGSGRWPEVLADAAARGYEGFATMEPHLLGGGPTGGMTGPELFPKAVEAFRALALPTGAMVD